MAMPDVTSHAAGRGSSSRRGFVRAGVLAIGGLTLGRVLRLRAESPAPGRPRQKSVIMIHLSGGPSHLDMYDMKPSAPSGYRGEFRPIRTNVPGMEICELMPRQAKIADKFAILRGVQLAHLHTANEFYSGYPWQQSPRVSVPGEAQRPAFGSVVSKLRGGDSAVPPYVSLNNQADWERSYYLGLEHEPFRVGGGNARDALDVMTRFRDNGGDRLGGRKDLLDSLDTLGRDLDRDRALRGRDAFQARALEMIASGKVRDAFDVDKEPEEVRARYGDRPYRVINQECNVVKHHQVDHPGKALLQARRLVEAGVSVVTVAFSDWDTHRYNFTTLRQLLPPLDQAVAALITDLDERGLLPDVAVLMGGEFGRTPKIGDVTSDGRSHWPEAGFVWVAGGGLTTGQVIGATDHRGEHVAGTPIRMQNVLATLYHVLGIDPAASFRDYNGRPQFVLEDHRPIAPLLG
jgi:hypothetical protein